MHHLRFSQNTPIKKKGITFQTKIHKYEITLSKRIQHKISLPPIHYMQKSWERTIALISVCRIIRKLVYTSELAEHQVKS